MISAVEFPRVILLQVFSVCPPPVCMGAPVLEVSLCQISRCLLVWKDCGSCYCPLIHAYQELLSSGDRDLEQLFSSFFLFLFFLSIIFLAFCRQSYSKSHSFRFYCKRANLHSLFMQIFQIFFSLMGK